jgi:hypothetical protein
VSLVIARSAADSVVVCSDLRAIDPFEIKRGYPYGILKAVTISSNRCVAFAGDIEHGLEGVQLAAAATSDDPDQLIRRVSDHITGSGRKNTAEFLVIFTDPTRIARLRGRSVEDRQSATWIGDADAFEEYQRLYHTWQEPTLPVHGLSPQIMLNMRNSNAFATLVREGSIASVGEAAITLARTADGSLQYLTSAHAAMPEQTIPPGVETPIRFGSAAEGGHAYVVLTPIGPGPGAVGLHFFQGQLGLLYHPISRREAFVYANVTHDGFRSAVLREHGIDIQGVIVGGGPR